MWPLFIGWQTKNFFQATVCQAHFMSLTTQEQSYQNHAQLYCSPVHVPCLEPSFSIFRVAPESPGGLMRTQTPGPTPKASLLLQILGAVGGGDGGQGLRVCVSHRFPWGCWCCSSGGYIWHPLDERNTRYKPGPRYVLSAWKGSVSDCVSASEGWRRLRVLGCSATFLND